MNFVKGGLKLKGKGPVTSGVTKGPAPNPVLAKRPAEEPAQDEEPKVEKKLKGVAALPPEAGKEESKEEVQVVEDKEEQTRKEPEKSWKTDYQRRVELQKQQRMKGKINDKLKSSHR